MSEVIAFKTTSNEEVVATLVEDNGDHLILGKARVLVMQQSTTDGSVSLGMLPFMASANNPDFMSESDIKMYKKDIIAEPVSVPDGLAKAYTKSVSPIEIV